MQFPAIVIGSGLVSLARAGYSLQDDYSGDKFFDMMGFDTIDDPTHGYVNYIGKDQAMSNNLAGVNNGAVTLKSDSSNVASGRGRDSIRVTSSKQYTHALVVLDLEHMPGNACGIWPAFWMTGPSWPNNGEIDIIEGVNLQSQDSMTLHTNEGCSLVNKDCLGNEGCGVQGGGPQSYGDGFNQAQGGVYATEWTSDAINIWFFSRGSIPDGISGDSPDPSSWGNPTASFQGSACNIDDHFKDNSIVFDTTFCGDWAGQVFGQDATCSSKASSCQDFVQNNPDAFQDAYWTINSLKVYSQSGSDGEQTQGDGSGNLDGNGQGQPEPSSTDANAPLPSSTQVISNGSLPPPTSLPIFNNGSIPSSTPAPAPSAGPVAPGSETEFGPLSENPIPAGDPNTQIPPHHHHHHFTAQEFAVVTEQVPGGVQTVVARSAAETPAPDAPTPVKPRALDVGAVMEAEKLMMKRGMIRHLRRHQLVNDHSS